MAELLPPAIKPSQLEPSKIEPPTIEMWETPSFFGPPDVGDYANENVPIEVTSQDPLDNPVTAPPDPAVGIRWGRPAALRFQSPIINSALTPDTVEPPSIVVENFDERVNLFGTGTFQAVDHFGRVIAEGPEPPDIEDIDRHYTYSLYYCGTFIEEDEETEALGNGVTSITPIIRHVRQYVQWDHLSNDELAWQGESYVVLYDGPSPPTWSIIYLPSHVSISWKEPLPKKYVGQLGNPFKYYTITLSGCTTIL